MSFFIVRLWLAQNLKLLQLHIASQKGMVETDGLSPDLLIFYLLWSL